MLLIIIINRQLNVELSAYTTVANLFVCWTFLHCRKEIQCKEEAGHNPTEDAQCALELTQYFINQGPRKVREVASSMLLFIGAASHMDMVLYS